MPVRPYRATQQGWPVSRRIIVASDMVHGATLLTQDRQILASKVVPTLS